MLNFRKLLYPLEIVKKIEISYAPEKVDGYVVQELHLLRSHLYLLGDLATVEEWILAVPILCDALSLFEFGVFHGFIYLNC